MINALYDQAILQKARGAIGAGRLDAPDGSAMIDNPLCGDRITIDLTLSGGTVATLGHVVRGCVLCEASAALIAEKVIGQAPATLRAIAAAIRPMLREGAAPPWPELEIFTPVRTVRSRHDCVELPFRALTAALDAAGV